MMDYHETKVCTVGKLHTYYSRQCLHRCRLNNNFELNSFDFFFLKCALLWNLEFLSCCCVIYNYTMKCTLRLCHLSWWCSRT